MAKILKPVSWDVVYSPIPIRNGREIQAPPFCHSSIKMVLQSAIGVYGLTWEEEGKRKLLTFRRKL